MVQILETGNPYLRVAGKPEGVYFDIQHPNIELIYHIERPTEKELAQVGSDNPFEIRAIELNDVIVITSKAGSLMWMDAPFDPAVKDCQLDRLEAGTLGYGLQFFLTDAPQGAIRHMRLIGLGNEFSRKFREPVYGNKEKAIPHYIHLKRVQEVYATYPTEKIAEYSTLRYKIKP